jgi:uncharacterized membrane protein
MHRIPSILLTVLLVTAAAVLYATAERLPLRIASHFDFAGNVNGYMSRNAYLLFMTLVTLGVPVLIVVLNGVLLRLSPRFVNLPSRDYWLAPERRDETYASLAAMGSVVACLLTAFMIALHLLIVEANARTPPRLDSDILWALLAMLIISMLLLPFFHWRRFRRPG